MYLHVVLSSATLEEGPPVHKHYEEPPVCVPIFSFFFVNEGLSRGSRKQTKKNNMGVH